MRRAVIILAFLCSGVSNAAEIPKTVPKQFQGTWAATAQQCAAPVSESKLVISDQRLAFYESDGPIRDIDFDGKSELVLVVELSGEGETWLATVKFRLSEDRKTLIDVTDRHQTMTRVRCKPTR